MGIVQSVLPCCPFTAPPVPEVKDQKEVDKHAYQHQEDEEIIEPDQVNPEDEPSDQPQADDDDDDGSQPADPDGEQKDDEAEPTSDEALLAEEDEQAEAGLAGGGGVGIGGLGTRIGGIGVGVSVRPEDGTIITANGSTTIRVLNNKAKGGKKAERQVMNRIADILDPNAPSDKKSDGSEHLTWEGISQEVEGVALDDVDIQSLMDDDSSVGLDIDEPTPAAVSPPSDVVVNIPPYIAGSGALPKKKPAASSAKAPVSKAGVATKKKTASAVAKKGAPAAGPHPAYRVAAANQPASSLPSYMQKAHQNMADKKDAKHPNDQATSAPVPESKTGSEVSGGLGSRVSAGIGAAAVAIPHIEFKANTTPAVPPPTTVKSRSSSLSSSSAPSSAPSSTPTPAPSASKGSDFLEWKIPQGQITQQTLDEFIALINEPARNLSYPNLLSMLLGGNRVISAALLKPLMRQWLASATKIARAHPPACPINAHITLCSFFHDHLVSVEAIGDKINVNFDFGGKDALAYTMPSVDQYLIESHYSKDPTLVDGRNPIRKNLADGRTFTLRKQVQFTFDATGVTATRDGDVKVKAGFLNLNLSFRSESKPNFAQCDYHTSKPILLVGEDFKPVVRNNHYVLRSSDHQVIMTVMGQNVYLTTPDFPKVL